MKKIIALFTVSIFLAGTVFAQSKTPHEIKLQESENFIEVINESTRGSYCDGSATDLIDEWISNVNFAGIDNNSGSTVYSDFTEYAAEVIPGSTYPISVTITNGTNFDFSNETVRVWIDWNQDFIWELGEESYDLGSATVPANSSLDFTSSITVPPNAVSGTTRMRVVSRWGSYSNNPCETFIWGEVEDYSVNVISPTPQPVSISNWALYFGILLMISFLVIRFRRII